MPRARAWLWAAWAVATAAATACLPGSGPAYINKDDAGPPPPTSLGGDAGQQFADVDLGDPFAIVGLNPSHGPWTGGTRTQLTGRGFPSAVRVFIGGVELMSSDIFASDPTHASIVTPAGTPGAADVTIRNDKTATQRTLPAGFFYDAFVAQPNSGATTGGTRINLLGSGTAWSTGTTVAIGSKPCTAVTIIDATHVQCTTPSGAPGTQDIDVTTPGGVPTQARDAFTYSDSPDGYRGGLGGGALNGNLTVLAFDSYVGAPIPGARAIAGGNIATAIVQATNGAGIAQISSPTLTGKVTVTVAAKCHQPITFVDVPVDTVTVYMDPVLDPSCGTGDPPSNGNYYPREAGEIDGELVWQGGVEFERAPWTNVPAPQRKSERQAAYVFPSTGSPTDVFTLPPASAATTPDSQGSRGYGYTLPNLLPGNVTIYALAGIEDRSSTPPMFTAYAMGVVRGVPVTPATQVTGVDIPMTTLLDHAVILAPQTPPPGPRGPDRLVSQLAVTLGQSAYAVLPNGLVTTLYPVGGNVSFIGIPSLDGALTGEKYTLGAQAVTGPGLSYPESVVSRVNTTQTNAPVSLGGFLAVPVLKQPSGGTWGGNHVQIVASGPIDLVELNIVSASGLVTWTIVAPGGDTSFDVPDLSGLPDNVGLVRGGIQTAVYVASINQFQYGSLRYGQLSTSAWNAFATDALSGAY
jgi:hypothetical protein